jgi:hypothetical protein
MIGNALVMIRSKMFHLIFDIPEYKFEYRGKVGEIVKLNVF